MTEISVPSPRQAPSAADVVRVLQAAYPNAWEKHLRNLGVTAPTDLPPAELTQFTNRVFWLVRQSGIKDPAAWVAANPAPVEATVAAATAPNRKSLKWNRRRRRRRPHHRAASSRCTAQAARAGRAAARRRRADANVADGDTPLVALMRETAAATVDTILAELRRRPIVYPEWLSLQDAAAYTGYSEQQFSDFVKPGVAPKSVLFSRNARRFKRSDVDAWCAAGGPSAYSSKGDPGAVRR